MEISVYIFDLLQKSKSPATEARSRRVLIRRYRKQQTNTVPKVYFEYIERLTETFGTFFLITDNV
jgi:hypothetical protein